MTAYVLHCLHDLGTLTGSANHVSMGIYLSSNPRKLTSKQQQVMTCMHDAPAEAVGPMA